MTDYQKYINALRKCAKEHELDVTFTGHINVSHLCEDTANLLETIEQEPFINKSCVSEKVCEQDKQMVLDKIRAEIKALSPEPTAYDVVDGNPIKDAIWETLIEVDKIIDKYKAESEG